MKGEKDKFRLTSDKLWDGMTFEGQYSAGLHSAQQCSEYTGVHLKYLYTNARSMRNNQEELETLAQSQSYDIIGISEIWWEEPCDWSTMMDGYTLSRRDRQGRQGGEVALYIKEGLDCTALAVGDDTVESLWVRVRGKVNKVGSHQLYEI